MKYKDFKMAVIAYAAAKGMMKEKQIKKIMKFECKKKENVYLAYFKYAGIKLILEHIDDYWYLIREEKNEMTFIKNGTTINECCDVLWENKTPENIQKNWYV